MDFENVLYFWSLILVIAALVLFVEAVALIRYFLRHRRPRWQCLLALFPLSVSVWAFIAISQTPSPLPGIIGVRLEFAVYNALMAPYFSVAAYDRLLIVICAVVFVLTLVIECIFHVRYKAGSQYNVNARSISLLSRDTENASQITALQSRKIG